MTACILIAEDDEHTRNFYLAGFPGFNFDLVESGCQLLELAMSKPYRLIITDVGLPDISGTEAVKVIREREGPNRNTCICALTGDRSSATTREVGIAGFDMRYNKPIKAETLTSLFLWASEPSMPREFIPDEGID